MNLEVAGTRTYTALDGGSHTVKVTAVLNGIESKGVTGKISIKEGSRPTESDQDDDVDDRPVVTQDVTTRKEQKTTENDNPATETTTKKDGQAVETTTKKVVTSTPEAKSTTSVKAPGKAKIKKIIVKKKAAKKVKIRLKNITGAKKYLVVIYKTRKNAKKNKKALVRRISKKTKITIKSKKLKNRKKLFVRVRAFKFDGNRRVNGKWSAIKRVRIKK